MIKIIRKQWLPTTLPQLAVWFANFALKFAEVYASLGFKTDDNAAVQKANETVQWLNDAVEVSDANSAALRSFRDQSLFGEKGDDAPTVPSMDLPAPPAELSSSIIQWLDKLKERIELADTYTPDIGAQLGIVSTPTDGVSESEVKPTVEAFPASEGYAFAVVVKNRAKADQNELQIRLPNQEAWQSLKTFTGKSCDAEFTPETPGQPVKLQIRVQLYRANRKYGQPSDAVYVTLNP